jgi:hypothetical protein
VYELDQVLCHCSVTVGERAGLSWLHFDEFKVFKLTPKGAWIAPRHEVDWEPSPRLSPLEQLSAVRPIRGKKWVSNNTYFCSPTKEEALYHCKRRAASYVRHCERRLRVAKRRMAALEQETPPDDSAFFSDNIALLLKDGASNLILSGG